MLLVAVALASGATLECLHSAGIGLFDSGLGCELSTSFTSYCEIVGVTTSCGVSVSCSRSGYLTTCTVPTPASACEVTVTLQDGTERTVSVYVTSTGPNCASVGIYGIALPLECGDAGPLDASDAMTDVTEETASDAAADATSE